MIKIISSGKRKTSIARAIITEGNGDVRINNIPFTNLQTFDRLKIEEPLEITKGVLGKIEFNAEIKVRGGGEKGQIEAARIALAKGIIEFTKSKKLRDAFLEYDRNLLVADVRRKEPYKPNDSKARKKRQSSKR